MFLQSNLEGLKARKKELNLTNQQLSVKSGVPVGTINKIFSGATKYPRQETMDALVKAMELDYYPIEEVTTGDYTLRETSPYKVVQDDTKFTLEDYYALPPDIRVELVDGVFYNMSAPSANHQIILLELSHMIRDYLRNTDSKCRGFFAPYDVQLDMDDFTMVQPDFMIICDREKYENGIRCFGAPDLVIEITSPSTSNYDSSLKFHKYQKAGVGEYWIVNPITKRITVHTFKKYTIHTIYSFNDRVRSNIFPGLEIDFSIIDEQTL